MIHRAMEHFAESDRLAPAGNDDAILRWNACVRLIDRHGLQPGDEPESGGVESFDDDVPVR